MYLLYLIIYMYIYISIIFFFCRCWFIFEVSLVLWQYWLMSVSQVSSHGFTNFHDVFLPVRLDTAGLLSYGKIQLMFMYVFPAASVVPIGWEQPIFGQKISGPKGWADDAHSSADGLSAWSRPREDPEEDPANAVPWLLKGAMVHSNGP